ncbi:MAG TPA: CFI-box-CTERM domain-containing protein [Polyangia bacterium]|nr:CFI-box-CTERM domain-containing protein [Polyangia bacterium]
MMWKARIVTAATIALTAGAAHAADQRAIVFTFTPTDHAQIAVWIESADGTFLSTVALTQAVAVHGIGNRPGASQMNSGFHWPYGRREGVLPIWAQRRASAPDALQFPRVIFQARSEGYASRSCSDSTPDSYYCLSFTPDNTRKQLDAVTCASVFNSDKGRIITPADVAAGYAEPTATGDPPTWQEVRRPLGLTSLYPPRRDFTSCAKPSTVNFCMGGSDPCWDHPDSATYVDRVRAVMSDIDVVTMATPPGKVQQSWMFSVPAAWADGEYVAYLEINTEGDYNPTFSATRFATPCSPYPSCSLTSWDSYAVEFGYPYRGQPSVAFRVPFTLGAAAQFSTSAPVGFGSVDGTPADLGTMHPMDATITDDPTNAPGSGADRLLMNAPLASRLGVEVRQCINEAPAPEMPADFTVAPVADVKHSHQWGHLHFVVPANSAGRISRYEVRTSKTDPIVPGDATSFIHGLPAQVASLTTDALTIPTDGAPGTDVDVDFGGLTPMTHYWVGIRAVDGCNRPSPHAVAEMDTTRVHYTQLPSGCFIATAAWGSAMEPAVAAMRHARDRLLADVPLFAVAADLYGHSGPPAARVLGRSDTARALVRQFLGPLATAAEAADRTRP